MADFCRQCAIDTFGFDSGDLRGLSKGEVLNVSQGFATICEGCGYTSVDHMGQCVANNCLEAGKPAHQVTRRFNSWTEVQSELSNHNSEFHLNVPKRFPVGRKP